MKIEYERVKLETLEIGKQLRGRRIIRQHLAASGRRAGSGLGEVELDVVVVSQVAHIRVFGKLRLKTCARASAARGHVAPVPNECEQCGARHHEHARRDDGATDDRESRRFGLVTHCRPIHRVITLQAVY